MECYPHSFQRSTFPDHWQSRISCIHDGICTTTAAPDPNVSSLVLADGTVINRGNPIITFVNRRIEPYRGCHTFIRSLPFLFDLQPNAHIVIVGEQEGVSYGKPPPQGCWKDIYLNEIRKGRFTTYSLYRPFAI